MATRHKDEPEGQEHRSDRGPSDRTMWEGRDDDSHGERSERSATSRRERADRTDASRRSPDRGRADDANPERPIPAIDVIRHAQSQLAKVTGRMPDSVSGFGPTDGGWSMTVEMVELDRIPASTSVLGTYEATLDEEGNLLEYQRIRRYYRNQAGDQ